MSQPARSQQSETIGRYVLDPPIAHGGMATVHTARLVGAEGFSRLVAAKRLHPQFTEESDFVTMFHDEARIASRIHHPNVVPVLDVVLSGTEVILVQEYVHGVPLSRLLKAAQSKNSPVAVPIVAAVAAGILAGLHAAHEVRDELDMPLHIVHRDVSPQNVMISVDGVPRLLDFGIAKARTSVHHTREGLMKGKLSYMPPEQIRMEEVTRAVDIYAVGVLLWELLTNRRFFDGKSAPEFVASVLDGTTPTITQTIESDEMTDTRWRQLTALEPIVNRAMSAKPEDRFATARDMQMAIIEACAPASSLEIAEWVTSDATDFLEKRQRTLAANEESWHRIRLSGTPANSIEPTALPSMAPIDDELPDVSPSRLPWAVLGAVVILGIVAIGAVQTSKHTVASASGLANTIPESSSSSNPAAQNVVAQLTAPVASPSASASAGANSLALAASQNAQKHGIPAAKPIAPPPHVRTNSTPSVTATSTATGAPSSECNPPFYFEGTKKIFKANCL